MTSRLPQPLAAFARGVLVRLMMVVIVGGVWIAGWAKSLATDDGRYRLPGWPTPASSAARRPHTVPGDSSHPAAGDEHPAAHVRHLAAR